MRCSKMEFSDEIIVKLFGQEAAEDEYFEENKSLTHQNVDFGYDWEIHPAFRWALSPDDISSILFNVGLSADN